MSVIRPSSTVLFTFETRDGEARSYASLSHIDTVGLPLTVVPLNDECFGCAVTVPLIPGFAPPFDFSVTDDLGTEHYIYYQEI